MYSLRWIYYGGVFVHRHVHHTSCQHMAVALSLRALVLGETWSALLLNFGTEVFGAVAIYVVLELLVERRERHEREVLAKKQNQIAQMGTSVKDVAVVAADELRRHGWLSDGSLHGANLSGANLSGTDLSEFDLSGANLSGADLSGADLRGSDSTLGNLSEAEHNKNTEWPDGFNPEDHGAVKVEVEAVSLLGRVERGTRRGNGYNCQLTSVRLGAASHANRGFLRRRPGGESVQPASCASFTLPTLPWRNIDGALSGGYNCK